MSSLYVFKSKTKTDFKTKLVLFIDSCSAVLQQGGSNWDFASFVLISNATVRLAGL